MHCSSRWYQAVRRGQQNPDVCSGCAGRSDRSSHSEVLWELAAASVHWSFFFGGTGSGTHTNTPNTATLSTVLDHVSRSRKLLCFISIKLNLYKTFVLFYLSSCLITIFNLTFTLTDLKAWEISETGDLRFSTECETKLYSSPQVLLHWMVHFTASTW